MPQMRDKVASGDVVRVAIAAGIERGFTRVPFLSNGGPFPPPALPGICGVGAYRLGNRVSLGQSVSLSLEAAGRERGQGAAPDIAVTLDGTVHW